jgi:hypothetical protein
VLHVRRLYIYLSYDTELYVRKHVGKWEKHTDLKLEDFEDTKGVIRIRKSKKDKRTNNDLQNTTQKTNDLGTRTPQKPGIISGVPEG